jgi:SAM-dependent methyltransferase
VNEAHLQILARDEWAAHLADELLPGVESGAPIAGDVIEIGPGPGLTTDLLRARAHHVTAVELDPVLAGALAERLADTNVEVRNVDAADTGIDGDRFTLAACFSMLHHVPTAEHQDRIFRELHRVLRPGGTLVAVDGIEDPDLRAFHEDDTFVPVDPATLPARLEAAGFDHVVVEVDGPRHVRFHATKP